MLPNKQPAKMKSHKTQLEDKLYPFIYFFRVFVSLYNEMNFTPKKVLADVKNTDHTTF